MGLRLAEGGRSFLVLERARRRRRHLARQPVPGGGLRHPRPPVLVLLPAEAGLVARLRPGRGDLRVPARLRARARAGRARATGHRGARGPLGAGGRTLADPDHARHVHRERPRGRRRPTVGAPAAGGAGSPAPPRCSTRRAGRTAWTSPDDGSASSGPGRRRCSSSRISRAPRRSTVVFQRSAAWVVPRERPRLHRGRAARVHRGPARPALRVGDLRGRGARLRGAAPATRARSTSSARRALGHLDAQVAGPRAARAGSCRTTRSAASGSCSPTTSTPPLRPRRRDARGLGPRARGRAATATARRDGRHGLDALVLATGFHSTRPALRASGSTGTAARRWPSTGATA